MCPPRLFLTLSLTALLVACGSRSFGGPTDDGGVPTDGASPDVLIQPYTYYGYVTVLHQQEQGSAYNNEYVSLSASFYGEQWDPFRESGWTSQTLQTPDGVVCELTVVSGMDGPIPELPPPEIDGGEIWAWSGFDGDAQLEIAFDGGSYNADYRSPNEPLVWPQWLVSGALALQIESTGSAHADPFYSNQILPEMPEITAPPESMDEPLTPDPDGTHRIAWTPVTAMWVEVALHFNMDWDDSYFRCYPLNSATQMRLPHQWLEQHSWGYGELMVYAFDEVQQFGVDGVVTVRTIRMRRQQLNIAVWD